VRPERPTGRGRALPKLSAPVGALASIVAGTLGPQRAAEAGLVEDARGAAEIMEPWFHTRPVYLHPLNAF
jgi:hypothetical protein